MSQAKTSKLPFNRLRIGSFVYRIIETTHITNNDHGETDNDEKRILINTNYSTQVIRDTLLHEIQHAIYNDTFVFEPGTKMDAEVMEERVIRVLTPGLMQVMWDNPILVEFLFRGKNETQGNPRITKTRKS